MADILWAFLGITALIVAAVLLFILLLDEFRKLRKNNARKSLGHPVKAVFKNIGRSKYLKATNPDIKY